MRRQVQIGDILVGRNIIDEKRLHWATVESQVSGDTVEDVLVENDVITPGEGVKAKQEKAVCDSGLGWNKMLRSSIWS